jgi:COMPASS component SWD2
MDAYSNPLVIVRRLTGHQGLSRSRDGTPAQGDGSRGKSGEEVCWSGDSKFVISGSNDGSICVWDLTAPEGEEKLTLPPAPHGGSQRIPTLEPIVRLQSGGVEGVASRCVRFNPRYGMLASGGEDLVSVYRSWLSTNSAMGGDDAIERCVERKR